VNDFPSAFSVLNAAWHTIIMTPAKQNITQKRRFIKENYFNPAAVCIMDFVLRWQG